MSTVDIDESREKIRGPRMNRPEGGGDLGYGFELRTFREKRDSRGKTR